MMLMPTRDELTLLTSCALRFVEDLEAERAEEVERCAKLVGYLHKHIGQRIGEEAFDSFFGNPVNALRYYDTFHNGREVPAGSQEALSANDLAFFGRSAFLLLMHIAMKDLDRLARGLRVIDRAGRELARRLGGDNFDRIFGEEALVAAMRATFGDLIPGKIEWRRYRSDMRKEGS